MRKRRAGAIHRPCNVAGWQKSRTIDAGHTGRRFGIRDRLTCSAVDRTKLFKRLEQGGALLRRIGLGRVVDRGRRLAERRMGRFETVVDGLRLTGVVGLHLQYVDELAAGSREDQLTTLFRESLKPGATVLDVGAHLGFMTLQAARAVGSQGHVYAAEPNPETSGSCGTTSRPTDLPTA